MRSTPTPASSLTLSIVTPSFNQGEYLEETIRSVLDQNYPRLQYVVVDGGSADRSREVIERYKDRLSWWVSEKDAGQYDAVNKGFSHCEGEVMGWINSDDKYLPWTFSVVAEVMTAFPQVEWLTSRFHFFWDGRGQAVQCEEHPGFSRRQVLGGGTLPGCGWPAWTFIQQEATFWRRSLWERCGSRLNGVDFPLAADFELWTRFAKQAELCYLDLPLAGFRRHGEQKTARQMEEYLRQAKAALLRNGGRPPGKLRSAWLRNSGKLLRFLRRRHAVACAEQGASNHAVYDTGSGQWALRDR